MSRAMAEGRHADYANSAQIATWNYQGKAIEVTYSKGGHISNGWVRSHEAAGVAR